MYDLHAHEHDVYMCMYSHGNHTYPKTDSLEYSLAFSHNSYSYPLTLLVL